MEGDDAHDSAWACWKLPYKTPVLGFSQQGLQVILDSLHSGVLLTENFNLTSKLLWPVV